MIIKKTIAALIVLFLFSIASMTGESAGSTTVTGDCQENAPGAANSSDTDSVKRHGYTLFSIEAPKRYESKPNPRNALPEDNSFVESLRMLLGLGVSDNTNFPRKPDDRGLLKDKSD
jgi:hypothetical protein